MRDYTKLSNAELADAYREVEDGDDDEEVVPVLNEIAGRLNIDPNETERGFSNKAFEQVFAFVRAHETDDTGYSPTDPKHPSWRERLASLWDDFRPGK
jgi:hypothetical protein